MAGKHGPNSFEISEGRRCCCGYHPLSRAGGEGGLGPTRLLGWGQIAFVATGHQHSACVDGRCILLLPPGHTSESLTRCRMLQMAGLCGPLATGGSGSW